MTVKESMAKNDGNLISVSTREASLKRRLRRHLKALGFHKGDDGTLMPPGTGKDAVRTIHSAQRNDRLAVSQKFLSERLPKLLKYFASGEDVDPAKISPVLQPISSDTWEGDLFRLASLTWSVPVSNGFGRRLRFLVWDNHNGKLIGIIAIGDPVFNLSVRDKLIEWDAQARGERLVNIMDAYVLGALPPYNALLGGKLVACLIRSRDVYDHFSEGVREDHRHHFETAEEGASSGGDDILFDGPVLRLQPAETGRSRILQSHRLHRRAGGISISPIICLQTFATTFARSAIPTLTFTSLVKVRIGACAPPALPLKHWVSTMICSATALSVKCFSANSPTTL